MRAITNLIEYPGGPNIIYSGCCNHYFEILFELDPGEADHEISEVYASIGTGKQIEILEIGGIPYTTPFSNSTYAYLTSNFILTQGNQLSIKYKYCSNVTGTGGDYWQLTLRCANHSGDHRFMYLFNILDGATITNSLIAENSGTFSDCTNNCGAIADLLHFNNPSALPLAITSTLSTTCGFSFFIDGTPIDILDFQMPPGNTVLQISNPGCAITSSCPFTIDFNLCGTNISIPINHVIADCDTCGIDCQGIMVQTNNIPGVEYAIVNPWNEISISQLDVNNNYNDWFVNPGTPGACSFIISPPLLHIDVVGWTGGMGVTLTQTIIPQNIYNFSSHFTNGQDVILHFKMFTGNWTNTHSTAKLFAPYLTGGYVNIPFPGGYIQPNTNYDISISIPSFTLPISYIGDTFISIDYGDVVDPVSNGNILEIYLLQLTLQLAGQYALLDPTNQNCSDMALYNQTAIGDSKTITYTLNYHNGWRDNVELWFNPWLFSDTGDFTPISGGTNPTNPGAGWTITSQTAWIGDGNWHPMTLVAGGYESSQRNGQAWFEIIDQTQFKIHYFFYVIEDINGWINGIQLENRRKLLYSSITEPNQLTLSNYSVYNLQKKFASLFYIYDVNINLNTTGGRPVYYECNTTKFVNFTNRFWNYGIGGGRPEMQNATFNLSRNSNPVTDFSVYAPTTVEFLVDNPGSVVDNIIFWVFDTSGTNNNIDFLSNYDSSRALITTNATPGLIVDNHIITPTVGATNVSGFTYSVYADIGNNLNPSGKYRIGAICYDNTFKIVNSFLSQEITVNTVPDVSLICNDLDVTSDWKDYLNTHNTNCFSPTIKERISNTLRIDVGPFNSTLISLGMNPMTNSWLDYLIGIQLTIYRKVNDLPSIGSTAFAYYNQYTSARNISFTGNWENRDNGFVVSDDGTTITTNWEGIVSWEDTPVSPMDIYKSPTSQYLERTLYGPSASSFIASNNITNNWGNQDIYFEYLFIFDVSAITNYASLIGLTYINLLSPCLEEPNPLPFSTESMDMEIYGVKGTNSPELITITQICDNQYDYLIVKTFAPYYGLLPFIAMFEAYPYSNFTLYENDTVPGNFTQLIASPLYDVDTQFDTMGIAYYKVDLSQLPAGKYRFSGLKIQ